MFKIKKAFVIRFLLLYCTLVPGMLSVNVCIIVCKIWPLVHFCDFWPSPVTISLCQGLQPQIKGKCEKNVLGLFFFKFVAVEYNRMKIPRHLCKICFKVSAGLHKTIPRWQSCVELLNERREKNYKNLTFFMSIIEEHNWIKTWYLKLKCLLTCLQLAFVGSIIKWEKGKMIEILPFLFRKLRSITGWKPQDTCFGCFKVSADLLYWGYWGQTPSYILVNYPSFLTKAGKFKFKLEFVPMLIKLHPMHTILKQHTWLDCCRLSHSVGRH